MMNDELGSRGEQRDRPPERDWRSLVIWALALLILLAAVYFLVGLFLQSGDREQAPEQEASLHHPTLDTRSAAPKTRGNAYGRSGTGVSPVNGRRPFPGPVSTSICAGPEPEASAEQQSPIMFAYERF